MFFLYLIQTVKKYLSQTKIQHVISFINYNKTINDHKQILTHIFNTKIKNKNCKKGLN